MPNERQPNDIRLTGIHIDLVDQIVTLEAQDGRRAKLSFGQPTTILGAHPPLPTGGDTPDELVADDGDTGWLEPDSLPQESRERQRTLILSGRLRSQPKAGRPDRQGRPTAWARLAVQDEGADQPHLYSATFYRATTAIALGLPRGAQVTLEGYPHAGDLAKKRLDTLAVIALHEYPGKPTKQTGEGVT
jgi:hypothetical protein